MVRLGCSYTRVLKVRVTGFCCMMVSGFPSSLLYGFRYGLYKGLKVHG